MIRDGAGKIQGVQKQERKIDAQAKTNAYQAAEIRDLRQEMRAALL